VAAFQAADVEAVDRMTIEELHEILDGAFAPLSA
jgi:hypothetical protein